MMLPSLDKNITEIQFIISIADQMKYWQV